MGKQKNRYRAWGEAEMNAWLSGNVKASVATFAEDCSRVAANPFGRHRTIQGREALREAYRHKADNWRNKKLISLKVLSANKERGIFHSWKSWTNEDGKEMACTYISIVKLDENDRCTEYMEWNVCESEGRSGRINEGNKRSENERIDWFHRIRHHGPGHGQ